MIEETWASIMFELKILRIIVLGTLLAAVAISFLMWSFFGYLLAGLLFVCAMMFMQATDEKIIEEAF